MLHTAAPASSPSQSSSPQITRADVEKTVGLAHLNLSADDVDKLTPEFAKIVSFIDTISELDLDGVEPMSRVIASENVLREDVPKVFGDVDAIMDQAPLVDNDFVRVPRIGSEPE
eukprot:Plantae.Rhodophyta-Palmaria_palmata.ctg4800.p2 GENE.Plantae.Rhodophyta-Palmaria_palmata.ctg4800~~Plantae.Rhodophyta-Palmaria_palmata.ctg4800.p2  ORF type:complete len:115 (-),score=13.06 Plantae.Rhodophyta-Palmaria_palmata.ctg4800:269-613(-)